MPIAYSGDAEHLGASDTRDIHHNEATDKTRYLLFVAEPFASLSTPSFVVEPRGLESKVGAVLNRIEGFLGGADKSLPLIALIDPPRSLAGFDCRALSDQPLPSAEAVRPAVEIFGQILAQFAGYHPTPALVVEPTRISLLFREVADPMSMPAQGDDGGVGLWPIRLFLACAARLCV